MIMNQGSVQEALTEAEQELRIPGFDLSSPGPLIEGFDLWEEEPTGETRPPFHLIYEQDQAGFGYYRLVILRDDRRDWPMWGAVSEQTVPLQPNRNYRISLLVCCNFARPTEINVGLMTRDSAGKLVLCQVNGLPNCTNGWIRWEWELTADPQAAHATFEIDVYQLGTNDTFCVSDLAIIELPPQAPPVYHPGEGATFRGGPGNLPMRIEGVSQDEGLISVLTTGAEFHFDLVSNTMKTRQRIEHQRDIAEWKFSLSLEGLKVHSWNQIECVLANEELTFGVQCDSLLVVVPHKALVARCRSAIGGTWNRLACGHLLAMDTQGGFAVNPDIPSGTGRVARVDTGVWPGRVHTGQLDFTGLSDTQTTLSQAEPGWQLRWLMSPGERLGISVFPPRPYPWKESFAGGFALARSHHPTDVYSQWAPDSQAVIMWDFFLRSWAMSWGPEWQVRNGELLRRHITAAKQAGIRPVPYMSGWFYYSRNALEFAAEVRRLKEEWGFEGVYYDGLPTESWVVAYEEMRLTREIYPDGTIILHHTYPTPLMEASIELPAITTYADMTFMGEEIYGQGEDWAYPKYMAAQYRKANTIGIMKHNKWRGLSRIARDLIMLQHNGRADMLSFHERDFANDPAMQAQADQYRALLAELQNLWEQHGDDPLFYEHYYLPTAKRRVQAFLQTDAA